MRKIKLDNTSKPKKCESVSIGVGKIAIRRNTIGSNNQAMEFLIDIEFLRRLNKMASRKINDTIIIMI